MSLTCDWTWQRPGIDDDIHQGMHQWTPTPVLTRRVGHITWKLPPPPLSRDTTRRDHLNVNTPTETVCPTAIAHVALRIIRGSILTGVTFDRAGHIVA